MELGFETEDFFRKIQDICIVSFGLLAVAFIVILSNQRNNYTAFTLLTTVILLVFIIYLLCKFARLAHNRTVSVFERKNGELQFLLEDMKRESEKNEHLIESLRNQLQKSSEQNEGKRKEYLRLIDEMRVRNDRLANAIDKHNKEYQDWVAELEAKLFEEKGNFLDFFNGMIEDEKKDYQDRVKRLEEERNECQELLHSTNPLDKLAELYKDAYRCVFAKDKIGDISIKDLKLLQYKIELLKFLYPKIVEDVENEDELKRILDYLSENRTRVRHWLSDDEFYSLLNAHDEIGMEELALNNYFRSDKLTRWEIGRNYEMFYADFLRSEGFKVDLYGIEHGVKDFGIDLVAVKGNTVWVIQCKNWGHDKNISEKVVTQTYGAMEYYKRSLNTSGKTVKAAVASSSPFTDDAKRIANVLGVKLRSKDMKRFRAVKCNVNSRGEKIYHLPFDRDYDRTKIIYNNEEYVGTVKEARDKGFRRAYKRVNNEH